MSSPWIVQAWVGLLLAGIGVPFWMGKIGPNPWAGARTAKTLADPGVWYPANRTMGRDLVLCGGFLLLTTAVAFSLRHDVPFDRLAAGQTVATLAAVTALVSHVLWTISRL